MIHHSSIRHNPNSLRPLKQHPINRSTTNNLQSLNRLCNISRCGHTSSEREPSTMRQLAKPVRRLSSIDILCPLHSTSTERLLRPRAQWEPLRRCTYSGNMDRTRVAVQGMIHLVVIQRVMERLRLVEERQHGLEAKPVCPGRRSECIPVKGGSAEPHSEVELG